MKVLYLCNKNYYLTKMSRVRFHSMKAIEKVTDFKWSGPNWENFNNELTVQENINNLYKGQEKPDVVVGFTGVGRDALFLVEPRFSIPNTAFFKLGAIEC